MFCPKCGTENPEEGKFCRSCGTGLGTVADALTGKFAATQPLVDRRGRPIGWDSAIPKLFGGLAFVAVSLALFFTGGGRNWWFWMLIPAFSMIGAGVAQIIKLKHAQQGVTVAPAPSTNSIGGGANTALPSSNEGYINPVQSIYQTGDLQERPPSVTEGTTRHLEMNPEGETMTLPKK